MNIDTSYFTLRNYFFHTIVVEAISEHDSEGNKKGTVSDLESEYQADDESCYVEISISVNLEESENPPYDFRLKGIAVFDVDKRNLSEEQVRHGALIYGTQVLNGAARELLAHLTARSAWGTFTLQLNPISIDSPPDDTEMTRGGISE